MALSGPKLAPIDHVDVPQQGSHTAMVLLYQFAKLVEEQLVTQAFERRVRRFGWWDRRHADMSIMGLLGAREALTTPSATSVGCAVLAGHQSQFAENFGKNFVATPPRASAGTLEVRKSRQEN